MRTVLIVLAGVAAALATPGAIRRRQEEDPCAPTPDPNIIEPGLLNISLNPALQIDVGGTHEEVIITGQSTIVSDIQFILITSNVLFDVTIPSIDIQCSSYEAEGYLDVRPIKQTTFPSGNFTSSGGSAVITLTNVHIKGQVNLWVILITNRVQLRDLAVSILTFDTVTINLGENYMSNGEKVDFTAINSDLKENFFADWATDKAAILKKIEDAANGYIKKYTLDELLDLILNPADPNCPTTPKA